MIFQNYVYIVVSGDSMCSLGVYPNFKKAYERLERIAENATIYDCNDVNETSRFEFETVEVQKLKYSHYVSKRKYLIFRTLLTIHPEDTLITLDMIEELEEANKNRNKPNYKLRTEAM